jgi:TRAP-type C4-dicarboxylate transport system permease small subunit
MRLLARLEAGALAATRALSGVGLLALMALAAMTLADGLMRWLAGQPIQGVRDVGALAIALAVSCCLPVGLMEKGNITIRLAGRWSPAAGRLLDLIAALLVLAVVAAMAWQFWVHARNIAQGGETTWVLRLPTAPFWYGVDAVLWCAALVQLIVVALETARLFGYEPERSDPVLL